MNYKELDFDRAIEDANKIILLGSTLKTGLFSSLTVEKDIPSLALELGADERALYDARLSISPCQTFRKT